MATVINKQTSPVGAGQNVSKLWYKNYMVWIFVIGLPLFVVVACIWFVFYSVKIQDSTVRDDWYMDGKTLYADVSKDKLAHDLGLSGMMRIQDNHAIHFMLDVPKSDQFTPPEQLTVEISHATQKDKDRDLVVRRLSDGSYGGQVVLDTSHNKYYIVVHDAKNSWRLRTSQELPSTKPITFKPLAAFDKKEAQ